MLLIWIIMDYNLSFSDLWRGRSTLRPPHNETTIPLKEIKLSACCWYTGECNPASQRTKKHDIMLKA